jgi:hypothetical protein
LRHIHEFSPGRLGLAIVDPRAQVDTLRLTADRTFDRRPGGNRKELADVNAGIRSRAKSARLQPPANFLNSSINCEPVFPKNPRIKSIGIEKYN